MDGGSGFNSIGIWSEGSGSLALIAREGSLAPDTVGEFLSVSAPTISENGLVAFLGDIPGGVTAPTHFDGVWLGTEGNVSLVAGDSGATPGPPLDSMFSLITNNILVNSFGKTAFTSSISCPNPPFAPEGCGVGAYSGTTGSLSTVASTGMNAPGLPAGVTVKSAAVTGLNDVGQAVISATLEGTGVDNANDKGIWSEGSGSLQLVAREGDSAPGTSLGVNFSEFRQAVINDMGKVAFRGELVGPGIVSTDEDGIWSDRSGALSLVVRQGIPAPGMETGVNFAEFEPPVMNNANQLAFMARLTGPGIDGDNNDALWLDDGSGVLDLLVREGDSVPGMAPNFAFFGFSQPVLNASGQVAFVAFTRDPSVHLGPSSTSLWIAQPNGDLDMIFSTGDQQIGNQIEVLPGDFRTINRFQFFTGTPQLEGTGQGDGRPSAFNDFGQLALQVDFSDDTEGIIVVSTTTIPEPSTLFLCLSFAMICLMVNRGRGRESNRQLEHES